VDISDPVFWTALLQIISVNIVLSGDNAVVIALAARALQPKQQKQAIFWGSLSAIVMRVLLTIFAIKLLALPYLKLTSALLLLWIGVQLLVPEEEEHEEKFAAHSSLLAAIRTILIADLVMSLDNVIGVAAAAKGSLALLILGLLISIPLVIFGSAMLLKIMERFPIIITIGGMLLGWVAGDMATTDPVVTDWISANFSTLHEIAEVIGALIVFAIGKWLAGRAQLKPEEHAVDLAAEDQPAAPKSPKSP
jgi:YjbE family integral membrane protein